MKKSLQLFLDDITQNFTDSTLYSRVYEGVEYIQFKKIFIHLHSELNRLFDFMNYKSGTSSHYNASESRDLINAISLIEDVQYNIKDSGFEISVNKDYLNKINEVKPFLCGSGGSGIPNNFSRIILIKYDPIFILRDIKITPIHKNIETYEHFPDFIKQAQEDLSNERYWDVITKARTILEITFKEVCKRHSLDFDDKNINATFTNIRKHFGMDAKDSKYPDYIKGLITNTANLVNNIAEARNKNSSSHAPQYKPKKHHAQFCLEQSVSLMNFIISVDESKK
jgi:hypothetical protein